MRCSQAAERLGDYIAGELSGPDRMGFESHLGHCEDCRSCVEAHLAIRSRMRSLLKVSAPSDLRERISGLSAGVES